MKGIASAIILQNMLDAGTKEGKNIRSLLKSVLSHPLKLAATFIFAPILLIKVASKVENRGRRIIAYTGLSLSILLSYCAGTFLGTMAGAIFVTTNIGILAGFGFLIGTSFSIFLSVLFCFLILNSTSFLFLKISTQEVIDHLKEISK